MKKVSSSPSFLDFGFHQKIPDGIIDETRIIIMPDKGKRKFICTLDDVPKRSVITSDNKKVWVDFRVEPETNEEVDYSTKIPTLMVVDCKRFTHFCLRMVERITMTRFFL